MVNKTNGISTRSNSFRPIKKPPKIISKKYISAGVANIGLITNPQSRDKIVTSTVIGGAK